MNFSIETMALTVKLSPCYSRNVMEDGIFSTSVWQEKVFMLRWKAKVYNFRPTSTIFPQTSVGKMLSVTQICWCQQKCSKDLVKVFLGTYKTPRMFSCQLVELFELLKSCQHFYRFVLGRTIFLFKYFRCTLQACKEKKACWKEKQY